MEIYCKENRGEIKRRREEEDDNRGDIQESSSELTYLNDLYYLIISVNLAFIYPSNLLCS